VTLYLLNKQHSFSDDQKASNAKLLATIRQQLQRVTIVIKTFMRYQCLELLIDSIQIFFPGTQVIVADNTPNEQFERINTYQYPFVKQNKMPPETGLFPGRALAISQVSTEYFISIDDDFTLTSYTKLDEFLKVIDESGYDMIGGPDW